MSSFPPDESISAEAALERDRALVSAWREGDSASGLALLDHYRRYFTSLCWRYGVRREEEQLDLYQEVLARLLRQLPTLRLESSFAGYLRRVVHTAQRELLRRTEGVPELPPAIAAERSAKFRGGDPVDPSPSPDDRLEQREIVGAVEECAETLNDRERTIFEARLYERFDCETLCRMVEVTLNHLHVLYHRARQKMRDCLARKGFEV